MSKIITTLSAFALSATVAHAGGMTVPQEPTVMAPAPMMQTYDWTGGYVGLGLTYGRATHSADATAPDVGGFPVNDYWPNGSGWGISGFGGYNWHDGNLVYGVEGHVSAHRMRGEANVGGADIETDIRSMASIRGRLGVAQDRTLFFVTAGPAIANVRHNAVGIDSESNTVTGLVIGAGIEHAMAGGWNIRGDIEHHRFRSKDFNTVAPGTFPGVRTRANLARISAVYRF
jgi:outer membrane immunogenic protein